VFRDCDAVVGAGETHAVQETVRFVEEVVAPVGGAPLRHRCHDSAGGVFERRFRQVAGGQ
jgi:hypothetical protein